MFFTSLIIYDMFATIKKWNIKKKKDLGKNLHMYVKIFVKNDQSWQEFLSRIFARIFAKILTRNFEKYIKNNN